MSNLQFVDILLHMVRRQLQCFQLFKKKPCISHFLRYTDTIVKHKPLKAVN